MTTGVKQRTAPTTQKLVLVYLAWRIRDPARPFYLSAEAIAAGTGLGHSTVRHALEDLVAAGHVVAAPRTGRPTGWTLPLPVDNPTDPHRNGQGSKTAPVRNGQDPVRNGRDQPAADPV